MLFRCLNAASNILFKQHSTDSFGECIFINTLPNAQLFSNLVKLVGEML